jgi:hypothetical protein
LPLCRAQVAPESLLRRGGQMQLGVFSPRL